jgi:hypothetical protein
VARGRFVSKSLWNSKRFAKVPERAANVYQCMIHNANVAGRLEADDVALMSIAGRYGQSRGWTLESMGADRDYLASVGLIELWGDGGENIYASIVKFFDHNKIRADREAPNTIPDPPGIDSRTYSGVTPPQEQVQEQVQVQDQGQGGRSSVTPERMTHDDRINLVLECWPEAFRRINEKNPDHPPMRAPAFPIAVVAQEIRGAEHLIDDFAGQGRGALIDEMKRIVLCMDEKGLTLSFKGVIRNLGQPFHGTKYPEPGGGNAK